MIVALGLPPFFGAIRYVGAMRPEKQMGRIAARRIIAFVADAAAVIAAIMRNLTMGKRVSDPV